MTLKGHSHWISRVRFNPFHDQLLVTGSTDSSVFLWAADSVSSAPNTDDQKNGLVVSLDDHEDSVYGVDWSVCDAWVFASLSYDGRVVINKVPQQEKYRIIL